MDKERLARFAVVIPLLVVTLGLTNRPRLANSDLESLVPLPVITVDAREEPLREVLGEISIQAGARLKIEGSIPNDPVSMSARKKHLSKVMDALCERESCRWKWESYFGCMARGGPNSRVDHLELMFPLEQRVSA